MLVPFLTDARRGMKYVIFGVLLSSIILFWASVMILLTINPHLAAHMWYPFFEMTKKIQIGFVENWDVLAVVIWISSVFIKLTVYMFIASYGTASVFTHRQLESPGLDSCAHFYCICHLS